MSGSLADVPSFLAGQWSRPIRRVCPHLSEQARERVVPGTPTPRWAQPQYLHYLLGEAIAGRLAWQATQPGEPRYRFGQLSEPRWDDALTLPYGLRYVHRPGESGILYHLHIEIERLYRIARTHPSDVGETCWTLTLVASCRALGRLFGKLRRRVKAPRARELLGQALGIFVDWYAGEAA